MKSSSFFFFVYLIPLTKAGLTGYSKFSLAASARSLSIIPNGFLLSYISCSATLAWCFADIMSASGY
jgi:hypothetical protein